MRFCRALQINNISYDSYYRMKSTYPEIYKHKPKKKCGGSYWFKTYRSKDPVREKILKQAIKETAPKKRSNERAKRRSVVKGKSVSRSRKKGTRK